MEIRCLELSCALEPLSASIRSLSPPNHIVHRHPVPVCQRISALSGSSARHTSLTPYVLVSRPTECACATTVPVRPDLGVQESKQFSRRSVQIDIDWLLMGLSVHPCEQFQDCKAGGREPLLTPNMIREFGVVVT